jgi:hypothetical protein
VWRGGGPATASRGRRGCCPGGALRSAAARSKRGLIKSRGPLHVVGLAARPVTCRRDALARSLPISLRARAAPASAASFSSVAFLTAADASASCASRSDSFLAAAALRPPSSAAAAAAAWDAADSRSSAAAARAAAASAAASAVRCAAEASVSARCAAESSFWSLDCSDCFAASEDSCHAVWIQNRLNTGCLGPSGVKAAMRQV